MPLTATWKLDRDLPLPLYHQLKSLLLDQIRSGGLKPDDRLTEGQLGALYHISHITVRRTLAELASEGYVKREKGRGTFVTLPRLEQGPRELTSFSQEMGRRGLRTTSVVLVQQVVKADSIVAEKLKLAEEAEVFLLKRLRLANGAPMGLQTAHVPLALAPGLPSEDFGQASLYEVLQEKYGLFAARAEEVHSARLVDSAEAQLLSVKKPAAVLTGQRIAFLAEGRPLELTYSVMRGDCYQIILDLVH